MAISQNQYDYLTNLAKAGGGDGEWAKSQLNGVTAPTPTPAPATYPGMLAQKPVTNTATQYSPPQTSYSTPTPNYSTPSTTSYSTPSQSYTGQSKVVGNTSGGSASDIGTKQATANGGTFNGWTDSKTGNVYDTGNMSPQQTYALMLNKGGNSNASAILSGMGLDMNGNQKVPTPSYTKNANVDAMPIDQQLTYYGAHPQEAQQEISRAQGVGGAAATNWANQLGGMIPQTGQATQSTGQQQNNGAIQLSGGGFAPAGFGQMSQDQIKAEAQSKINQQITDRSRIANQTKAGFQTSFDRLQSQTKDNRTLENVANQRNLNPFSGRSDYAQAMIGREREITDRQGSQDLQSKLANVDIQLSDFLNQTPEMQQNIINDLTRQERDYGLQVASQNRADKQLSLTEQNQQFNQQQDLKKQHIDLANFLTEKYGMQVNPTDDPMLSYAQVAGIPTLAAQKIAQDAVNMSFDNAVKKALAENTINKTQADILQQAQQLSISQQNANTSAYSASASAGNAAARLAWEQDPKNPDNIYKLSQSNKPKTTDYKNDPNFAADVSHLKSSPTDAAKLDSNPQPFIDAYGYDGYLALRKAAELD